MPKAKITKGRIKGLGHKHNTKTEVKFGYWLYRDGYSYWGMPLVRYNEVPIEINKGIHDKSQKDKIDYRNEQIGQKMR